MKKLLTLLVTTTLLCSCFYKNNEKADAEAFAQRNAYSIETPYGIENLYDETTTPEVYAIVATRAVNKMLDQTRPIYENLGSTFLYIMEVKKMNEDLPNGFYLSQRVTRDIVEGSRTYTVVNNMKEADYYLETLISKIEIEGQDSPILQYKLIMFDKSDKKINEWIETIRKVKNDDRSWW